MGDYEASTVVDVAANILFDYLSDIERLPEYLPQMTEARRLDERSEQAQGLEARRPGEPVRERVEVAAVIDPDDAPEHEVRSEAIFEIVEEGRKLRWSAPGPHEYHGELDVDFVADGSSKLTVRLHTDNAEGPSIDEALQRTVTGIKSTVEGSSAQPRETPGA
ncbi:SRPBCC family protein [Kribbella qitaiheensis]|uniref:SRPBCC family protein n=1 Tax=Kribbella qitaiheensis TaxID=1544730 RepID=A0A7G6WSG6_9ACTN|nr:SRPBCC family protein [Kribbella qitaiheensis]QNE16931.1 SRPBCC family protein [Kribbella qitaiheensis]